MEVEKRALRLLELEKLLVEVINVERFIAIARDKNKEVKENDAEHSYVLAMLVWYLSQFYPHLDRDKMIRYALAHDVVEVYAGDVMAIERTDKMQADKDVAEAEARERLKKEWPDFEELHESLRSYESLDSDEARFVSSLDKLTPIMHNFITKGKTWKDYDMMRESVLKSKDAKATKSPEVAEIWQVFRKIVMEHDEFFNEGRA